MWMARGKEDIVVVLQKVSFTSKHNYYDLHISKKPSPENVSHLDFVKETSVVSLLQCPEVFTFF